MKVLVGRLSLAVIFYSTPAFASLGNGSGFISSCIQILENAGLAKVKDVPKSFNTDIRLSHQRDFLSQFKLWTKSGDQWLSYLDTHAISRSNLLPGGNKLTRVKIQVDQVYEQIHFWMIADHNIRAMKDRIRQILFARILFSRMYPQRSVPKFHASIEGINGVAVRALPISDDSFLFLSFLMRQVQMYPGDATVSFGNMTQTENEDAERWFVGYFDQSEVADQHIIIFKDLRRNE